MKKIEKKSEKIIEATCDICGEDCMKSLFSPNIMDGDDNSNKEFEGMELIANWGYSSNKDGEKWTAIVCEKCVDTHLNPLIKFLKEPYF